jgi:NADH:ubiquinone oxidoreductase subunit E
VAIVRGIAVMFDAGPDQCGAVEVAMDGDGDVLGVRCLQDCDQPPVLVWLGQVGLCEDHVLRMWPELGESN